jgi:hypothetical protein
MSIAGQFMILGVAFAVAMPSAVSGLVFVFYQNQATARRLSAYRELQAKALFALTGAVGQVQSTVQRLFREKDPDNLEKLMEQSKVVSKTTSDRIRDAGAVDAELGAAFKALPLANEKSIGFVLQGNPGMAEQTLIEESNPALERLLAAIDRTLQASSKKDKAVVAEAEGSSRRAQLSIFILVGAVLMDLVGFALAMVRRITQTLGAVAELKAGRRRPGALELPEPALAALRRWMDSACVGLRRCRSGAGFFRPARRARACTGCLRCHSSIAAAALATSSLPLDCLERFRARPRHRGPTGPAPNAPARWQHP